MNTRKYVIALDQGTTSSRAVIFDDQANLVGMKSFEFEQIYPHPGWVEHNPMEIWSSQLGVLTEAMAKIGAEPEEIAAIAQFADKLPGVDKIHLLPYHRLGQDKYDGLGREYLLPHILPPENEHMEMLKKVVENVSRLNCQIGG